MSCGEREAGVVRQQRTQERRHDREHVGMLRQAHHPPLHPPFLVVSDQHPQRQGAAGIPPPTPAASAPDRSSSHRRSRIMCTDGSVIMQRIC